MKQTKKTLSWQNLSFYFNGTILVLSASVGRPLNLFVIRCTACHQCQIPLLDRKSHLAVKAAQLLNLFAFRREEGNKVLGFPESLHFCTKLVSHTKPNRKAKNQFFQTKRGFCLCSWKRCFPWFERKRHVRLLQLSLPPRTRRIQIDTLLSETSIERISREIYN